MAYYIPGKVESLPRGLHDEIGYLGLDDTEYRYAAGIFMGYFQNASEEDESEADEQNTPDVMMMKKEQNAELDKKIEALRKKNEALMKRYQEVEEDKKKAEEEGMALQSRKAQSEDLTITINKSTSESRVVTKKPGLGGSPNPRGVQDPVEGGGPSLFGSGRGRRRQLLVTMAGNTKGKRVVSERVERNCPTSQDGQRCHRSQEDGGKQDLKECDPFYQDAERPGQQGHTDLTIPTSPQEQQEYLQWKREREQIDRERVARHRNAKGQWKRAWDVNKPEMFSDKAHGEMERGDETRGGRNAKRGHQKSTGESRGHQAQNQDKKGKNPPVVSSKAKGKDRLTGRARRWDAKDEEEHLQASETSLEEFLEELDAMADPEVDSLTPEAERRGDDLKAESSSSVEAVTVEEAGSRVDSKGVKTCENTPVGLEMAPAEGAHAPDAEHRDEARRPAGADASSPKGPEKKVRFSEDLIQGTSEKAQNSGASDTKVSSLKGASQGRTDPGDKAPQQTPEHQQGGSNNPQEQGVSDSPLVVVQEDSNASEIEGTESKPVKAPSFTTSPDNGGARNATASLEQKVVQPLEHMKNATTRSTEELIDSSLSVLSLDSGEPHPDHITSTDKI